MQAGAELHVASTGSAEAFLYRGPASTRITTDGTTKPAAPSKTFGSIATGQLEAGDRVLLATPALVHQLPLTKLQSVISQSSPNAAIAELTNLLKGPAETERVAALIIEVTTPELAALQVRSEQPSEVELGAPENALEAAKLAATPIAHSTLSSGKKLAGAAHRTIQKARPHARAAGLAIAEHARNLLSTKKGRRLALTGSAAIVVLAIALLAFRGAGGQSAAMFSKYQSAYSDYSAGQKALAVSQPSQARTSFALAQSKLASLSKNQSAIDHTLTRNALPEGEPRTYAQLVSLISQGLDQLDGLVRSAPTTVANLRASARLTHFELVGGKAYAFDSASSNALSIIDLTDGKVRASSAATSKLGAIVATTIASDNSGIFILTSKPDVWLYHFQTDSLTEQSTASGDWPSSLGLASYGSNLYLLTSSSVYKFAKYPTGYSTKTLYLGLGSGQSNGASAIAVDGSVYLASDHELLLYLLGVLKQSASSPAGLASISGLRSQQRGTTISGVSPKSNRIALWSSGAKGLAFDKQIQPTGVKNLYDASIDPSSGLLYAVADNRLVRFSVQP
jgi:hypothetical protein